MTSYADLTAIQLQEAAAKTEANLLAAQRQVADLSNDLKAIRQALEKRMRIPAAPRVSDHALLRFIERVMGIDVDAIRDRILSDNIVSAIKAGATAVTVDSVRMVVKDNVVVTVIEKRRA